MKAAAGRSGLIFPTSCVGIGKCGLGDLRRQAEVIEATSLSEESVFDVAQALLAAGLRVEECRELATSREGLDVVVAVKVFDEFIELMSW